jgi:ankyrin repeat protein
MQRARHTLLLYTLAAVLSGCLPVSQSNHPTLDYTPVAAAATSGDLATVRTAVGNDPSLVKAATDWDHATLLHDAVQQNHQDVATYLLDKGADVDAVTSDGLTPLHMAAQNGNVEMCTLLLARGAKINAVDAKGWTPLDRALKWAHPTAAEFLRQHGGRGSA